VIYISLPPIAHSTYLDISHYHCHHLPSLPIPQSREAASKMVGLAQTLSFFHSQFIPLPTPTKSYADQTIIVTGSNIGLGLEAARHFVRLSAAKVILAVRSPSKGAAAARSIANSTGRTGVVEVWDLDLSSYASVLAFADRAAQLDRLDVLVSNAGIVTYEFVMAEGNESTITVNVLGGMLLGILLLPKLRETAVREKKETVLSFTGSFVHFMTEFPERKTETILAHLAIKEEARMQDRLVPDLFSPPFDQLSWVFPLADFTPCGQILRLQTNPTPARARTRLRHLRQRQTRHRDRQHRQPGLRQDGHHAQRRPFVPHRFPSLESPDRALDGKGGPDAHAWCGGREGDAWDVFE
jgi:hypothetical protein